MRLRTAQQLTPLPEAFAASEEAIEARRRLDAGSLSFGGFAGASLALFLAARKAPGRGSSAGTALVIASGEEEADELAEELGAFSSLEVLEFPPWDLPVAADVPPDGGIFHRRLATLEAILRAPEAARFIVAPVQAVLQPVPTPGVLRGAGIQLECGRKCPPLELAETLARRGLRSRPLVEARGEFSLRGDILDIYPWGLEHPLRIEFFGDSVESIRAFQAESQRSRKGSELVRVDLLLPCVREFCRGLALGGG
jgi:transcription-repair coupling factor (superfamily II helicase)